ncbi:MAG: UDP-N-acetylmuramoyl-L-alanine--D-glutamate ligase [Gammaproteobacteria bacterium]|nr:UDP-N-acetylmuramoyl-L-alanine--D-glutamate ligase [Gammaproteobacteria bacterium]MBT8151028.1 UDP-N-acetylmuramoyl-L-alanine--D-glutamate ligase [Gammaproteobacteria bacterium]NND39074.1 UDP-N-acetylmuramoyl-L-alanine--D-glutamate ligase [Pseudomonadales bacterium]NNM11674.1 UDP-N-acetylmuramoyl-L-alanine--D-glutamate ligase [Pseudomonadales bacterium]
MQLIQSDKKRVVVGLGLTGRSTMRFFQRMGLPFVAGDTRESIPDMASLREEFPDVQFHFGQALVDVCPDASDIYLSPGLAVDLPDIVALTERGARVSGDLDLFMAQVSEPVFAISGSNAKSTVTTLLGQMIAAAGKSVGVGGNLGKPMLDLLEAKHDCYVLELSSFQLERAAPAKFAAAALLNVSADHMDRHKTLVEYHRVKQSLFAATEVAVFNRQDPLTEPLQRSGMALRSFGWQSSGMADFCVAIHDGREMICRGVTPLLGVDELRLPGRHNVLNVMAALAMADAAEIALQAAIDAAKSFTGLAHRCELVANIDGVAFINDSKATNVGACIAALQGFAQPSAKIVLIAGGQTKSADFAPLAKVLESIPCELVLLGEGAEAIAQACRSDNNSGNNISNNSKLRIHFANSMEDAVARAGRVAGAGDIVLLSPACASFDMYSGFAERGDAFKAAVNALASGGQN